jgi:hypothetical protein
MSICQVADCVLVICTKSSKPVLRASMPPSPASSQPEFWRGCRVVNIPQRYKQRHDVAAGDGAELRAHFVRGHFKARKTGVFFWSAYRRGNPALGFAHKDYRLARGVAA